MGAVIVLATVGASPAQAVDLPSCATVEAGPAGPAGNRLEVSPGDFEQIEIEPVLEGRIRVRVEQYEGHPHAVVCSGGTPTVTSIDEVVVRAPTGEYGYTLTIDVQEAPLAPGATDEGDGSSEIETTVQPSAAPEDFFGDLYLVGGAASDRFQFGAAGGMAVNLNAGEAVADSDLTVSTLPDLVYTYGGPGGDVISASGGAGTGSPSAAEIALRGQTGPDTLTAGLATLIEGGFGDDQLIGSGGFNFLLGGRGGDSIRAGGGRDLIIAGKGRDQVQGEGGADIIYTADRQRDSLDCGQGRDAAGIDRRDQFASCERRIYLKGTPRLFD